MVKGRPRKWDGLFASMANGSRRIGGPAGEAILFIYYLLHV
jgi:hypothetical protein